MTDSDNYKQYGLTIVAVVGLISVVALVALVMNGGLRPTTFARGTQLTQAAPQNSAGQVSINPCYTWTAQDTLHIGQYGSYTDNYDVTYIVVPLWVSTTQAKFTVNGEVTPAIIVGQSSLLSNGAKITLNNIQPGTGNGTNVSGTTSFKLSKRICDPGIGGVRYQQPY